MTTNCNSRDIAARAQRRSIIVADATTNREYNLTSSGGKADFCALGRA